MTLPKRAVIIFASVGMLLSAGTRISFAQTDEQLADYSRRGPYLGIFFVYGKEAFDVSASKTRSRQPRSRPYVTGNAT
jgi:hypothetical protein